MQKINLCESAIIIYKCDIIFMMRMVDGGSNALDICVNQVKAFSGYIFMSWKGKGFAFSQFTSRTFK